MALDSKTDVRKENAHAFPKQVSYFNHATTVLLYIY